MAYSNTNKDKVQARPSKNAQKVVLVLFSAAIIISSGRNMIKQAKLIELANVKNSELLGSISNLEAENLKLTEEIKYATSSEGIKRNLRLTLGLGESGDYWLKIGKAPENTGLYQNINVEIPKTNWEKWWNLFTY